LRADTVANLNRAEQRGQLKRNFHIANAPENYHLRVSNFEKTWRADNPAHKRCKGRHNLVSGLGTT